jgi:hypothetical protein
MPIPFRPIARLLTRTLRPAPQVNLTAAQALLKQMSEASLPEGVLLTANHYSALDFQAWWFVIPISAILPVEIHWLVTSGWTNSGWLNGFTHWLFPRGAHALGFTPMPAMPPDPQETEQRAIAVREALAYARHAPRPVIGIAPEGGDQSGGVMGHLPAGVGRFMYLINKSCPIILPVGVWKEQGCIQLNFGSPYRLDVPPDLPAYDRDRIVGEIVMRHIALLLPDRLRGEYQ